MEYMNFKFHNDIIQYFHRKKYLKTNKNMTYEKTQIKNINDSTDAGNMNTFQR